MANPGGSTGCDAGVPGMAFEAAPVALPVVGLTVAAASLGRPADGIASRTRRSSSSSVQKQPSWDSSSRSSIQASRGRPPAGSTPCSRQSFWNSSSHSASVPL
eukprot:8703153-Lingulodinium_polyedra.AAC.1